MENMKTLDDAVVPMARWGISFKDKHDYEDQWMKRLQEEIGGKPKNG